MIFRHVDRPAAPGLHPGSRRDRGETLIELLVMIVLMGVGFTAIFTGLIAVSRVNSLNQKRTQASSAIQAWAEGLQQPASSLTGSAADPYTYVPCAFADSTGNTYGGTGQPSGWVPSDWGSFRPVKVEYATGNFLAGGEPEFTADKNWCYANGDKGLQRITIQVTSPAGKAPVVSDTLVILKRNQKCPPVANGDGSSRFDNADLGPC